MRRRKKKNREKENNDNVENKTDKNKILNKERDTQTYRKKLYKQWKIYF